MASIMFRNWSNELEALRPTQLLDQHFGIGLHPDDLQAPLSLPLHSRHSLLRGPGYYRPWRTCHNDHGSTLKVDKGKFEVNLDVQQFAPDEISVKTIENIVVVEGKHDEKPDEHGSITRHFVRKYTIPLGHDMKNVQSNLSDDGILTITAAKVEPNAAEVIIIPIIKTGPHKVVKEEAIDKQ